jgi:probable rRNA maturation factor
VRGEIAIALVTNQHIRKLNQQYRRKDSVTDVLSFAAAPDRAPSPSSSEFRISDPRIAEPQTPNRGPRTATREPRFFGDIVIATGVAQRQAREARHSYSTELRVLALHGLLHLLGYDHEDPADRGRMARAEARLRRKGGLPAGLIRRAGVGPRSHKKR